MRVTFCCCDTFRNKLKEYLIANQSSKLVENLLNLTKTQKPYTEIKR